MGFLAAAQKGQFEIAAEYLNTRPGKKAALLAEQLSVVLDRRLPARLNQISDKPEGSLLDPLHPDRDLVGMIPSANGNVPIMLERIETEKSGLVWLFSSRTVESIPDLYEEIEFVEVDNALPEFFTNRRVAGIPLFEWLAVLVGLPLIYLLTSLLNRILSLLLGFVRRSARKSEFSNPDVLPIPVRLLLIAVTIRWLLTRVGLSLLARQFWSSAATVTAVAALIWILVLVNARAESYAYHRLQKRNLAGTASVLRLGRRVIDVLLIFGGVLVVLYAFGVNPTAGLAGLGVGGIAVALAAQKTLENVIGGVSVIFDQVIRVGDTLKLVDVVGTVEEIGLRSTRIRTLDRTVVSVPNGQIASMNLETLSARDKFRFHPSIGIRYTTTPTQIRFIVEEARSLLTANLSIESESVRVRFVGFGSSSLDLDLFAYVFARDWNHFLEIQEKLLLSIMEIVRQGGTEIAIPSRLMLLAERNIGPSTDVEQALSPNHNTLAPGTKVAACG